MRLVDEFTLRSNLSAHKILRIFISGPSPGDVDEERKKASQVITLPQRDYGEQRCSGWSVLSERTRDTRGCGSSSVSRPRRHAQDTVPADNKDRDDHLFSRATMVWCEMHLTDTNALLDLSHHRADIARLKQLLLGQSQETSSSSSP